MSSPSRPRPRQRQQPAVPPGFRAPPKPKRHIELMDVRELNDLYNMNARILAKPQSSTASFMPRINAEQNAIQARLLELESVDKINTALHRTHLDDAQPMVIDDDDDPPASRTIEAKHRAAANYMCQSTLESAARSRHGATRIAAMSVEEAIRIEQEVHAREREREQRHNERRRRQGLPVKGEVLTAQEKNARMMAFLIHKPTESDMEDDTDSESDDNPAHWFEEDDNDDGIKGQDIVMPDAEDLLDLIRVDPTRAGYSTFCEPRYGD
ncbi:hypothetical protein FISHEDRAFT_70026 [Fistulina hepatica ATCC 64428]|uniref:Uncharacterized protein n=1 Tax=Fistulina hepatica ATCC 64428 TaxID=1128425 RepID=A0A0D7AM20_9AGAR|nr:hypothetical protein FISHEDRAFT_70026 [Fistulina hepatica ATCC 64428]